MLTRLKVDGFKNLIGVDLRFGPYTCIAGANGVGKSNVFDAIAFLGSLADMTFAEAIAAVRSEGEERSELDDLLYRNGQDKRDRMRFECEFLIPAFGTDELGQTIEASATFLRYSLELRARTEDRFSSNPLELMREELTHVLPDDLSSHLPFVDIDSPWLRSVLIENVDGENREILGSSQSSDRNTSSGSERDSPDGNVVVLYRDEAEEVNGVPIKRAIVSNRVGSSPRTVLSRVSFEQNPTAVLARQALRSWRRVQLDVSAMRRPDSFDTPIGVGRNGAHLARTLYGLALRKSDGEVDDDDLVRVLQEISNRVGQAVDGIERIGVEIEYVQRRISLFGIDRYGTQHDARSLSEGTLRFLALALLEHDGVSGLICLEEPENGLHPSRIEATVRLLRDIAVDTSFPDGTDNPLRQMIVNTHSPGVVRFSPAHSVVIADRNTVYDEPFGRRITVASFRPLAETWREALDPDHSLRITDLLSYLDFRPLIDVSQADGERVDRYVESRLDKLLK